MHRLFLAFCVMVPILCGAFSYKNAHAEGWVNWHAENVQFLRGSGYKLGESERSLITLEHASNWKYGDNFAFIDITFPDGPGTTYYTEIAPRLSWGKMTGHDFSFGPVSDVLFAFTYEKPEHMGPHYLYGLGVDLDVPGFTFLNVNGYIRDDTQKPDSTWQVTVAWKRLFSVSEVNFSAEGFADFMGSEGETGVDHQLIVPRLLVDVGDLLNVTEKKLWGGVEYTYWHNKFGIEGVTESVAQFQIKYQF